MRRYIPISVAILIWAWTAIFIKMLQDVGFDPFTQNFYRYLAASIALLALTRSVNPAGFRTACRKPWIFLVPGLAMTGFQTLWVLGIYRLTPAFTGLIGNSGILLVILIGLFYADERRYALSPKFVLTILVGLVAVAGFIVLDPRARLDTGPDPARFYTGTALVLAGTALWVAYAYLAKWLVRDCGALVSFSFSAAFSSMMMLAVAAAAGWSGSVHVNLGRVLDAPWPYVALLFASGVMNVGVAQAIFQHSIRALGVSLTEGLVLIIPLFTALFSYLVRGEVLTLPQWGCGLVLLASSGYLTVLGRRLAGRRGVEPGVPE